MKVGDYCWGKPLKAFRILEMDEEAVKLAGIRKPVMRDRITGSLSPGDTVFWLPFSNNWQRATVLDKAQLTIQLARNGKEIELITVRYLMRSESAS